MLLFRCSLIYQVLCMVFRLMKFFKVSICMVSNISFNLGSMLLKKSIHLHRFNRIIFTFLKNIVRFFNFVFWFVFGSIIDWAGIVSIREDFWRRIGWVHEVRWVYFLSFYSVVTVFWYGFISITSALGIWNSYISWWFF